MSKELKQVWNYKNRGDWWKITTFKIGEKSIPGSDDVDFEWRYIIERDGVLIYDESIIGQYNEPLNLQEILSDFAAYISQIVIGFSVDGVIEK